MQSFALSLAMIAVFLLGGVGGWLLAARRDVKRGLLMILAALVIAANVAIWSLPTPPGS